MRISKVVYGKSRIFQVTCSKKNKFYKVTVTFGLQRSVRLG